MALLDSDTRVRFDVDWLRKWTSVIQQIDHVEKVFIRRRDLALKRGVQRATIV